MLRRLGGRHTFRRRTLHHCAGAGRRLSSALCSIGRRTWSASVVTPRKERTRRFTIMDRAFCGVCDTRVYTALDAHTHDSFSSRAGSAVALPCRIIRYVKGSGRACLEHLGEKHGGSTLVATTNVAKFFPPWTVTRDVWLTALRPDVSGVAWMLCFSMKPDAVWCIVIASTRTRALIRRFGTVLFPAYYPVCAGPWPSPSSLL